MFEEFYEDEDEFSDDEVIGCKRFIDIELPKNFNVNKPPTSGEEYLHHVIYETSKIPSIVVADVSKKTNSNLCTLSFPSTFLEASKSFLPNKEWSIQKVTEFVEFRKYIHSKLPRPNTKDDLEWRRKIIEEYPRFSVVSKFNLSTLSRFLDTILSHFSQVKKGDTISDIVAVWTYTVLALLPQSLLPSDVSVLRCIASKCNLIKSHLPEDAPPDMYKNLNFFISIIGLFYKQNDVLICAE